MKINRVTTITKCITSKVLRALNQTYQLTNNDDIIYRHKTMVSAEEVARTLFSGS